MDILQWQNMNKLDYILIQNLKRHMVKLSRAYHSAEIGSENFPVLAHLQLKLKKTKTNKSSAKTIRR